MRIAGRWPRPSGIRVRTGCSICSPGPGGDEAAVLAATRAVEALDDRDGVLITDETGEAKSPQVWLVPDPSTPALGVCQVAVHLAFVTGLGHTVLGRALYLPKDWAADDESRELTGVPKETGFVTKPELVADPLTRAVTGGVRVAFFVADEVYGTRHMRRTCRTLRPRFAPSTGPHPGPGEPARPRST